jgi:hypothetical protein
MTFVERRLIGTAALRTIEPLMPVNPTCSDPMIPMKVSARLLRVVTAEVAGKIQSRRELVARACRCIRLGPDYLLFGRPEGAVTLSLGPFDLLVGRIGIGPV